MKVLIAPDKFKGSLTANQAAQAMASGVVKAFPDAQIDICPVADGGEGTLDAMLAATGGTRKTSTVTGPLGKSVDAQWGVFDGPGGEGRTAIIEMAAAAGLTLIPQTQRDPTKTTTFGVGELIREALDQKVTRILLGIGGSGTNDAATGAVAALGVRFLDSRGQLIPPQMLCGGVIDRIATIDTTTLDPRLKHVRITAACDVTNPMTGLDGAAHVYGPQKGATPVQVEQLDRNLRHIAKLFRTGLGRDVEHTPGAGAAGAMGAGLMAFLGAELRPGIAIVLDAVGFDCRVQGASLCLTGEGKLDGQSLAGKVCAGVALAAKAWGVPTLALVGATGAGAERSREVGIVAVRVIGEGLPVEESMRLAGPLLTNAAERAACDFVAGTFDDHRV